MKKINISNVNHEDIADDEIISVFITDAPLDMNLSAEPPTPFQMALDRIVPKIHQARYLADLESGEISPYQTRLENCNIHYERESFNELHPADNYGNICPMVDNNGFAKNYDGSYFYQIKDSLFNSSFEINFTLQHDIFIKYGPANEKFHKNILKKYLYIENYYCGQEIEFDMERIISKHRMNSSACIYEDYAKVLNSQGNYYSNLAERMEHIDKLLRCRELNEKLNMSLTRKVEGIVQREQKKIKI